MTEIRPTHPKYTARGERATATEPPINTRNPHNDRMPQSPSRPCRHPGCSALVASGYCSAHAQAGREHSRTIGAAYDATARKDNHAIALAARIRSGSQWQKVRAIHAAMEPLCRDPFGDHQGDPVPRAQSHHIMPLVTHPHLAYDLCNLASLCARCHRKVEAMERRGEPTCNLFSGATY